MTSGNWSTFPVPPCGNATRRCASPKCCEPAVHLWKLMKLYRKALTLSDISPARVPVPFYNWPAISTILMSPTPHRNAMPTLSAAAAPPI